MKQVVIAGILVIFSFIPNIHPPANENKNVPTSPLIFIAVSVQVQYVSCNRASPVTFSKPFRETWIRRPAVMAVAFANTQLLPVLCLRFHVLQFTATHFLAGHCSTKQRLPYNAGLLAGLMAYLSWPAPP